MYKLMATSGTELIPEFKSVAHSTEHDNAYQKQINTNDVIE